MSHLRKPSNLDRLRLPNRLEGELAKLMVFRLLKEMQTQNTQQCSLLFKCFNTAFSVLQRSISRYIRFSPGMFSYRCDICEALTRTFLLPCIFQSTVETLLSVTPSVTP